jgi:hypothetical protein
MENGITGISLEVYREPEQDAVRFPQPAKPSHLLAPEADREMCRCQHAKSPKKRQVETVPSPTNFLVPDYRLSTIDVGL